MAEEIRSINHQKFSTFFTVRLEYSRCPAGILGRAKLDVTGERQKGIIGVESSSYLWF